MADSNVGRTTVWPKRLIISDSNGARLPQELMRVRLKTVVLTLVVCLSPIRLLAQQTGSVPEEPHFGELIQTIDRSSDPELHRIQMARPSVRISLKGVGTTNDDDE